MKVLKYRRCPYWVPELVRMKARNEWTCVLLMHWTYGKCQKESVTMKMELREWIRKRYTKVVPSWQGIVVQSPKQEHEVREECQTGGCEGGTVFNLLSVAFCWRLRDEGWSDDWKVRVKRKRWSEKWWRWWRWALWHGCSVHASNTHLTKQSWRGKKRS